MHVTHVFVKNKINAHAGVRYIKLRIAACTAVMWGFWGLCSAHREKVHVVSNRPIVTPA